MFYHFSASSRNTLVASISAIGLSILSGCALGTMDTRALPISDSKGSANVGGILHGGPNPIVDATVTLYSTTSNGYGAAATVVSTTSTGTDGSFSFTLPTGTIACPSGEYAYVIAYSGSTGSSSNNAASLLMSPIGLCDTFYTHSGSAGAYANTYTGGFVWIDELTTAVSAYALGNFMTVTNTGVINIGAPANNHGTASAATPSAAGLGHAFQNALNIVNTSTGQPYANLAGRASTTGGIIPDDEIFLIGNMLQACVNSNGPTAASTATANDGTACGKLFSFTTPPQVGAAVPVNTMQAMLNLAKYPAPAVNTWNPTCTAAGAGTTTATTCLFNLALGIGSYPNGITAPPPDWSLAIVFPATTGKNTTNTTPLCTGTGTSSCPGLTYPAYVALDYMDNVYTLNWTGGTTTTYTNIVGFGFDGTPIFASPEDTADLLIKTISTDTAGHVIAANNDATINVVKIYSATSGATLATLTAGASPQATAADPLNNIYIASTTASINTRKATYSGTPGSPVYAVTTLTTVAPASSVLQLAFNNRLDLFMETATPNTYILPNTGTVVAGTPSAPVYSATGLIASGGVTGTTTNSYGIAANSAGGAYAVTSLGITPIIKSGTGSSTTIASGSAIALPNINLPAFDRYVAVDGLNNVITADGANGSAQSGIAVYSTASNLSLGIYKGCFINTRACGAGAGQVPMYSARDVAIDSAGDVWVVSGASANLTELIGAAAPTWPGLSMGLSGEPQ